MHEGCSGSFENGKQVVDKVRMNGFDKRPIMNPLNIKCEECGDEFIMEAHEGKCPKCGMVYGVTPCSSSDPKNVMAAGKDY